MGEGRKKDKGKKGGGVKGGRQEASQDQKVLFLLVPATHRGLPLGLVPSMPDANYSVTLSEGIINLTHRQVESRSNRQRQIS